MKKLLISILIAVFISLTAGAQAVPQWDGSIATAYAGGSGTEDQPYLISNGAELAYLAKMTNENTDYSGLFFKLTSDIDLNSVEWTPIGNISFVETFKGTFDGNGKAILNLKISTQPVYGGVFGIVHSSAKIKNLGIKSGSINVVSNSDGVSVFAGGIAAINHGSISNCYNNINITGSAESASYASFSSFAGGIVGQSYGNISECFNTGEILAIAINSSFMGTSYAGGIVGQIYDRSVTNCYNTADIKSEPSYAGGISGMCTGSISNSYSLGIITSSWSMGGAISGGSATVQRSYYLDGANTNAGGGVVKSESEMKTSEFVDLMNEGLELTAWKQDANASINSGFPALNWQGDSEVTISILESQNGGIKVFAGTEEINDGAKLALGTKIKLVAEGDANYVVNGFLVNNVEILGNTYIVNSDVELSAEFIYCENVKRWNGSVADSYDGGTGSKKDPYRIVNAEQLAFLAQQVKANVDYSGKNFRLMNNIDLNLIEWTPIGVDDNVLFKGNFDGNYKTIANLSVNNPELKNVGLFGAVNPIEIKNLGIIGASNISIAEGSAGAIVGLNHGTIMNCYSNCTITASYHLSNSYAGGITGKNSGTIINCYNLGNITASGFAVVGGISATNTQRGKILNSYGLGKVSAERPNFAAAGAMDNQGEISNVYYIAGSCVEAGGAISKTDGEMKTADFIAGLNNSQITSPWMADNENINEGFPIFKWQAGAIFAITLTQPENGQLTLFTEYGEIHDGDKVIWNQEISVKESPNHNYVIDYYTVDGSKFFGDKAVVYDAAEFSGKFIYRELVTAWDGSIATSYREGSGTEDDPYLILGPDQLALLAFQTNSGVDTENKYYKLVSHVDLRHIEWTPIGVDKLNPFKGTFDGNGQTISNLNVNSFNPGLFGTVSQVSNGIKNVGITGVSIISTPSVEDGTGESFYAGAIASKNFTLISDCYSKNSLVTSSNGSGGIVGSNAGKIENCYNTGRVESIYYAGGIAAYNEKEISNSYNVGPVESFSIHSIFSGAISGSNSSSGSALNSDKGKVTNCYYLEGSCKNGDTKAVSKNETEMKSDALAELLNKDQEIPHWATDLTPATNEGFLILKWQDGRSFLIETFAESNGSISPSATVTYGASCYVVITPDANYHIDDVVVDGISVGAVDSYEFKNIIANHNIKATFAINKFTITVTAGPNGSISPETVEVEYNTHQTFTITPDEGYVIDQVMVDGVEVGPLPTYTFTSVNADHSISASFKNPTGVDDLDQLQAKIYSFGSSVYIDSSEEDGVNVQIFDISGKIVSETFSFENKIKIDLPHSGTYVVRTFGSGKVKIAKIIIK